MRCFFDSEAGAEVCLKSIVQEYLMKEVLVAVEYLIAPNSVVDQEAVGVLVVKEYLIMLNQVVGMGVVGVLVAAEFLIMSN